MTATYWFDTEPGTPPVLTPIDPVHLQVDVPLNAAIWMRLHDDVAIADGWTVDVQRHTGAAWELVYTHLVGTSGDWAAILTTIIGGYELTLEHPLWLFPTSSIVTVRVTAYDEDGLAIAPSEYSFTTVTAFPIKVPVAGLYIDEIRGRV
jgi:hypothetical protein